MRTVISGILAGLSISIGGTVFLLSGNKILGAVFFTVGLFCVCAFGFSLFTGKVCYVFDNDKKYAFSLILIWLGNLIGSLLVGLLLLQTRLGPELIEKAAPVCKAKLEQGYLSAFILAFFCDIMIYIGVEGYKSIPHEFGKYLALFFGVTVFVICGFEHCVANMFYFTVGKAWSVEAVFYLLIMTVGNAAGGGSVPLLRKLLNKPEKSAG